MTDCAGAGSPLGALPTARLWELRDGSERAREQLILRYLPLAGKLAARYRSTTESHEDLRQVARLGLVRAVDRFDHRRGYAFMAFAVPTILGELKRHFRDASWALGLPRSAKELALRVQWAIDDLSEQLGRSPTVDEIGRALGIGVEQVLDGLNAAAARYPCSLDAPVTSAEHQAATLMDVVGDDDDRYALTETAISLSTAIRHLPHPERRALRLCLDDGLTQSQIARVLGCSQMQVSRLLKHARVQLATELESGRGPAACTDRRAPAASSGQRRRADHRREAPPDRRRHPPAER